MQRLLFPLSTTEKCLMFVKLQHSYNTRSATADKFYIMSSRLDQLKNSFSRFSAWIWNSLPDNIRNSDNRKLFKKQIHEILINILRRENAYLAPSVLEKMNSL